MQIRALQLAAELPWRSRRAGFIAVPLSDTEGPINGRPGPSLADCGAFRRRASTILSQYELRRPIQPDLELICAPCRGLARRQLGISRPIGFAGRSGGDPAWRDNRGHARQGLWMQNLVPQSMGMAAEGWRRSGGRGRSSSPSAPNDPSPLTDLGWGR